ncbi:MAG: CPBP family intramembrane metalloprotease [bacterium]|nr:CPBP family intramembrane metalloprotease [bacterium]
MENRWLIWGITAIYLFAVVLSRKPGAAALGFSSLNFSRLALFIIVGVVILTAIYLFFVFHWIERQMLIRLIFVFILYPLLSVPAQEFFFRSFFFFRYGQVFKTPSLIVVNALSFAYYHIIFGSWRVAAASLVAGVVLSILYKKHQELFLCCIIHAIFGILVFLAGWAGKFTTLHIFAT